MEEKVPNADEQQLQHMLTDSDWDRQAVIDRVALEADRLLGGDRNSCLLIDESGFKKSGRHSVGVGRQWCGRLGKVDNCQVGVFAALGRDRRVTLVDERLYLQKKWIDDPKPTRKKKKGRRGRKPTELEANAPAIRVDAWQREQPDEAWKRVKVRESSRGELEVDVVH
jgi:SRSO17 transposase